MPLEDPYGEPPSAWRIAALVALGIAVGLLVLHMLPA